MHSNRIKIEKRHSNLVQLATSGNHGVFERTCKVLRTSPANFLKNIISLEASLPSRFQNVRAFAALQAHTPASTQARDCPETRNRVIRFHAAASIEIFVRLVNAIDRGLLCALCAPCILCILWILWILCILCTLCILCILCAVLLPCTRSAENCARKVGQKCGGAAATQYYEASRDLAACDAYETRVCLSGACKRNAGEEGLPNIWERIIVCECQRCTRAMLERSVATITRRTRVEGRSRCDVLQGRHGSLTVSCLSAAR